MNQLRNLSMVVRRVVTGSLAVLLLVSAPAPVYIYADESCSPVTAAPTGVNKPTGADAVTYTYNSCTGLWENEHYTWNPSTYVTTPKVPLVYTYNATTKKWDTKKWVYAPASSSWIEVPESVDTPPAGAKTVGGPTTVTTPTSQSSSGSAPATTSTSPGTTGTGTGSGSTTTTTNGTTVNDSNKSGVNNQIGSSATSGNTSVTANTNGGSATSGDAQAIVNAVNMLQSSSGLGGSTAATFVVNIDGDVQGDLVLDPNALQPAANVNTANNLNVNVANNGSINNDITVAAQSGNAGVTANTSGGNATSGNAQAVANVVNMLNSMIAAQQSFLGVINVNGNFNGNILMPQQFLDTLLSSNAPHETVAVSQDTLNQINANLSNSTSINNNVTDNATSGAATVGMNTNGGTATSGSATTNVTVFNLTNQQITGANTLLVFVNVLGKWVGVLMDAPAGSTAVAYGGGITSHTTNTANVNASNTGTITNNINASAQSGPADVSMNTVGGNARSGNADTAVNLANITNSDINLTGWFGILFINVFGNWNGSFGALKPHTSGASPAAPVTSQGVPVPQVFGFKPAQTVRSKAASSGAFSHRSSNGTGSSSLGTASLTGAASTGSSTDSPQLNNELSSVAAKVLGAHVAAPKTTVSPDQVRQDQNRTLLVGGALFLTGMVMLTLEQIRSRRAH